MRANQTWRVVTGFVVAAVLMTVSMPDAKAYGELKWMASSGGPTSVPAGWVIIRETGTQYQIENVAGAAYGAKVVVTLHSAVPTGWVIDFVLGGTVGSRYLEYVTGAPYGTRRVVELDSPVPTGWVIAPLVGGQPGSRLIECTLGASYQTQLRVMLDSPVPANWVITWADATGRYINYVAGAPFGTQIQVTLDSPVPTGWLIASENNTNRKLICTTGATYGSRMTVILRSPVPTNWVITREDTVSRDLMFVGGATYQARVTVTASSPVWPNWVIVSANSSGRDLEYVGGAPQGTVITITLGSPVPPGWVVISVGTASRDILFGTAGLPAPTGLTAVKGGGFIQLTWNAVSGAIGYNVKQRVFKTNPSQTIASNLTAPHYTDTNVSAGYTYYYVVTAIGSDGKESPPSTEIGVSPLAEADVPTTVVATPGNTQVTITWTAPAGGISYNVKKSLVSKGPYAPAANMITTTSFVDTLVTNGTTYYYVVTAISSKNIESGPSLEVSAKPNIPPWAASNLTALAENRRVTLNWNYSVSPNVVGYNVYRHDSSMVAYTLLAGSPTPVDNYVDNTVGNGTLYTYTVRAVNDSNQESPDSNLVSVTPTGPPPPPAPTGLSATPLDGSVELSWMAVAGALTYNVKRSTLQSGPYSVVAMPKTNGYTDTGLVNGTTYYYVVSALDSSGAESVNSTRVSAQPYVSFNPPPAPNNLTATGGVSQIQLSWDAVGGATLYKIHRAPTAFGPWNQIGTAQTNSYTDTLVLYGEIYYYNVSAVNGIGEGAQSATVSATDGSD